MRTLQLANINYVAVLVAWILHTVLGLIWFSPRLFGKAWSGLTGKELKPAKQWIIPGFLGHLVMILILAILIQLTNSNTALGGLFVGLLTWIGFVVPLEIGELVWEKIPFKLFLLRLGNQLIGIAVSGIILGAWH